MSELIKPQTKTLTKPEIDELYKLVNQPGDWKIDVNSYELVDKLIELWFKSQGYDFWNNPYPEIADIEILL